MVNDRLIYAEQAKTLIKNYGMGAISDGRQMLDPVDDIILLAGGVDLIPAANAVPVVRGRWVDRYGGKYANPLYECSECKEKAMYVFENDSLGIGLWKQKLTDYCPNCGARMDGERSDGNV